MGLLLICLSLATQLEVCALGLLGDQGADIFKVFKNSGEITLEQIQQQWPMIAPDGTLGRKQARAHLMSINDGNPLKDLWLRLKHAFDIDDSIEAFVLLLLGMAVLKAVTSFAARYAVNAYSISTAAWWRRQLFSHLQRWPMALVQQQAVGSMASKLIQDTQAVAQAGPALLHNLLHVPFVTISSLLLCWRISWQLTLMTAVGLPIVFGPAIYLSSRLRRAQTKVLAGQEGLLQHLIDWLHGLPTVRLLNIEAQAEEAYGQRNTHLKNVEKRGALMAQMGRPVMHVVSGIFIGGIALVGLWGLGLSIGALIVFAGLLFVLYEPLKRYAEDSHIVQKGVAATERIMEIMNQPVEASLQQAHELPPLQHQIELRSVSFHYVEGLPVLRDINIAIGRGQMVAIVGSTGSGKSTLANLLVGIYPPTSGEIFWDGTPYSQLAPRSLRQQIALVPQRPFLFQASVRENITFGTKADDHQLEQVLRKAQAWDFVQQLPAGLDTILGEQGKTLSGGQIQRLAIARALLRNSSVLILDEATSSVDTVSEAAIQQTFRALRGQQTMIVIAHRLSTVVEADWIVVLERGAVAAQGTLNSLLEHSDAFRRLWEAGRYQPLTEVSS